MEIGSEFWLEEKRNKIHKKIKRENCLFFISGRTAIDYAVELIEKKQKINTVYFPSYCCQSMLQPFIERNIKIVFYTVIFENGSLKYDINYNQKCDVFFAMNYFGYSKYNMDNFIEEFKKRNIYVIEDSTHSILSKRVYNKNSDFVVASIRKWFPIISGGILLEPSNSFRIGKRKLFLRTNKYYIKLRKKAMIEKAKYINNETTLEQKDFLKKYLEANKILKKNYKKYKIDYKSYKILRNIDINEGIEKRRRNAEVIYKYLKKQEQIQYLKDIDFEKDCPFFVPIFLTTNNRDELKQFLIEKQCYFPNHWEIPENINNIKQEEIYKLELSFVCDQRYNEDDIRSYLKIIDTRSKK